MRSTHPQRIRFEINRGTTRSISEHHPSFGIHGDQSDREGSYNCSTEAAQKNESPTAGGGVMNEPTTSIENIALYIRVSTEEQAREGYSLGFQEEEDRRWVERKLIAAKKIEVYKDVMSGNSTKRPAYNRMMEDCRNGKIDAIVFWREDRFTRNMKAGLEDLCQLTEKLNVRVFSVLEGEVDMKDAECRHRTIQKINDAEYERNRLKQRSMPGMERGAKSGRYQGTRHVFFGARYNKTGKKLEWREDEVKAVKILFDLVAKGESVHRAGKYLYEQGYRSRTNGRIPSRVLCLAIKRRIYCDGYYRWKNIISEKPIITPVIDEATWQKANETVSRNRLPDAAYAAKKGSHRDDSPYILQGVLKCRTCASNLIGHVLSYTRKPRNGNPKRVPVRYYVCSKNASYGKKSHGGCDGQWIKAEPVEKMVYEVLKTALSNKSVIECAKIEVKQMVADRNPELMTAIRLAQKQQRELEQNHRKLLDLHYRNALNAEQFKAENDRIVAEQTEIGRNLDQLRTRFRGLQSQDAHTANTLEMLEKFDTMYADLDSKSRKNLFNWAFEFIHVKRLRRYVPKFALENYQLRYPLGVFLKKSHSTENKNTSKIQSEKEVNDQFVITSLPMDAK